jgi:dihydrofolate reductase
MSPAGAPTDARGCEDDVRVGRLIYTAIISLDGYVEDEDGDFSWAAPDDELHAFVNALERPLGIHLYGRRMYETLVPWETMSTGPEQPAVVREFAAMWRAAEKIVYSRSMSTVSSQRTRIVRDFDPRDVAELKRARDTEIGIGGPELARQAFEAGLIDDCHLFLVPVLVGAGKRALPDHVRAELALLEERRFASGVVHLHHRVRA